MEFVIDIPDETVALLQGRGVQIVALAEDAVAREALAVRSRSDADAVAGAVDRLLERRSRLALAGLTIRDLIDDVRDRRVR